MEVQREVTRLAAAARQPGVEMNETYGMSASEVTSQDNQSRLIVLTYPGLCKSGYLILTYPGIWKSRHLISTYPGLSQSVKSIPGYPSYPDSKLGRTRLAQGVAFPDDFQIL